MSATTQPDTPTVRTYGGWRRTRGIGLFGLGPTGTLLVLACLVVPLLLASVSITAFAASLLPAALVTGGALTRVGGMSLAQLAGRRLSWAWASTRGWTSYRATTIAEHPRAWDLPGVLAPARLLSAPDERGGTFGLVWNRRTGHLTATLRCTAASTWLVNDEDADGWVANWHSWLAGLGYLPMVHSVAVTVETAPEAGTTLRDAVLPRLHPSAPADVRDLMHQLVDRSPAAAADVDTRVSITFDPARAVVRLRDLDEAAAEISRQLTGLESALVSCGVAVRGRATAGDIAGIVRVAFDPTARGDIPRLTRHHTTASSSPDSTSANGEDGVLDWADAGPVAADETWDTYRHDSAWSVTWGWHEAPRQQVTSNVLARLLSPARYTKRVTLIYRPLPAAEAARVLEAQVNAAAFRDAYRRSQRRDESARDVADRAQAQRAATEEAQGAGVVHISLYVTATVTHEDALPQAIADIESRAGQAKIRLRRLHGAQAAGFASALL